MVCRKRLSLLTKYLIGALTFLVLSMKGSNGNMAPISLADYDLQIMLRNKTVEGKTWQTCLIH